MVTQDAEATCKHIHIEASTLHVGVAMGLARSLDPVLSEITTHRSYSHYSIYQGVKILSSM